MILALITLVTGLALSAISAYYSILGLMAIFAAAPIPIMIMGSVLETSKLVATVWLKQNWSSAPATMKTYLVTSVIILMLITSLGGFGFLARAHLDQSLPSGELVQRLEILDEKIRVERETIATNRRALQQLDTAVDQIMARSTDERGAARSSALRRSQQRERSQLMAEIESAQAKISALVEQRAPLSSNLRQVEAKVGPIKYLASFFYGSTDADILEKSVMWVIVILIIVFDPLAVVLLLASQISFQKHREEKNQEIILKKKFTEENVYKKEDSDSDDSKQQLEKVVNELIDDVKKEIKSPPKPYNWAEPEIDREYERLSQTPTLISESDYQNLSRANFEKEIEKWVNMVKRNQVIMSEVPKSILMEVRARI